MCPCDSKGKHQFFPAGRILFILHAAFGEKYARSLDAVSIGVFVAVVDDALYAALDDSFSTFIAGEKRNIERTAIEIADVAVEDRIQFCMADERILCVELRVSFTFPRHFVVDTAGRHTIITDSYDLIFLVHDASADLSRVVLAALS